MKAAPLCFLFAFAACLVAADTKPSAIEKLPEKSIYRNSGDWSTDEGRTVRLDSLRGRPVVMALFFTNCQHSCPLIVNDMKAIQAALSRKAESKVEFVLASIDPDRDSVEALRAFRKKYKLNGERWALMRSDSKAVRQLADKLHFQYSAGSQTQFAHSLLVTVLDADGIIAHQQAGTGVYRRDAISTLEKLAASKR